MNGKIKLILIVAALAVLVGGSSLLYNVLLEDADGAGQLVIYGDGKNPLTDKTSPEAGDTESENSMPNDSEIKLPEADKEQEIPDIPTEPENDFTEESTPDKEPPSEDETPKEEIARVPDFVVYTEDGEPRRLSDYFGKPIVLNFWASWCGPCRSEMPHFEDTYTEYGDEVEFLMVNLTFGSRESFDAASSFIEDSGYTFPVLYDTAGYAAYSYKISSIPTTYFISREGKLVASKSGAISKSALEAGIELIK